MHRIVIIVCYASHVVIIEDVVVLTYANTRIPQCVRIVVRLCVRSTFRVSLFFAKKMNECEYEYASTATKIGSLARFVDGFRYSFASFLQSVIF